MEVHINLNYKQDYKNNSDGGFSSVKTTNRALLKIQAGAHTQSHVIHEVREPTVSAQADR